MPLRPLLAAALLTCIGCGNRTTTLQSVAKDWCLTIRASQVIPVYPLTEDLQPGDVFLVQTSIHNQAEAYEEKGFLPLDQLTTRLQTETEYQSFYANAYLKGYHDGIPHNRPAAADNDSETGESPNTDEPKRANTGRYTMAKLPAAQFPSYEFDIERGMGLKLAIPVQGIPVGLGLLRTDTATGSIIIRDAFTYGLPGDMLLQRLHTWADRPDVRRELVRLKESVGDCPIYLRIVNRVYLVGGVDVVLRSVTTTSAGGDVGAPQSINLLSTRTEDLQQLRTNAELYKQASEALGGSLNDMTIDSAGNLIPGGSVRYAYAGSRAVTMQEKFDRLLALGYLGFDVEILEGGRLGTPVSTLYRITSPGSIPQQAIPSDSTLDLYTNAAIRSVVMILQEASRAGDTGAKEALDGLNAMVDYVPETYDLTHFELTAHDPYSIDPISDAVAGSPVPGSGLDRVQTYLEMLDHTRRIADAALRHLSSGNSVKLTLADGTSLQGTAASPEGARIRAVLHGLREEAASRILELRDRLRTDPLYQHAVRHALTIVE